MEQNKIQAFYLEIRKNQASTAVRYLEIMISGNKAGGG